MTKKALYFVILVLIITAGVVIYFSNTRQEVVLNNQPVINTNINIPTDTTVVYNSDYGFTFSLPISWRGYSIIYSLWEGNGTDLSGNSQVIAQGPLVSIRHPEWTNEKPRQDIPIMVFTLEQWADLGQEKFHIGAAPIGPMELGRNNFYVFALPARYNYAFLPGYEEVDNILQNKSLKVF